MAKAIHRYEKIDYIINATNPLFNNQTRQVIFASKGGGYSAGKETNIDRCVEDGILYFIGIQSDPKSSEIYCDLIDETLRIERFTIIENISEESRNRIRDFVEHTWHLMGQYARMKSGEVHQIWMEAKIKNEQTREANAIAEVRKTYAAYDVQRWMAMDSWTVAEAAALSMRIEPEFALDLPSNFVDEIETDFSKALELRIKIINRAVSAGIFLNDTIMPKTFVIWSKSKGWDFDETIKEASMDAIHTNTRHRLYSILLSMAFERYKLYPVFDKKHRVRGDVLGIARDCEICGFPVGAKTIQKHLDLALEWAQEDYANELQAIAKRNAP
ncbi:hypothetical protein [Methylobacterium sp. GC_Met_2]|uniref:hypothetical protein n=1 Tax=Methylobacterium sp. GC_Met_2 TaxID=2937376 RepID=UPI00226BA60F|nr:hypothetical protein [Methylobacterium sp. GC_Met_2]